MSAVSTVAPLRRKPHAALRSHRLRRNWMSGSISTPTAQVAPHGFGTDPRIIQAITQTMIGEFLWKYTRKAGRSEMSEDAPSSVFSGCTRIRRHCTGLTRIHKLRAGMNLKQRVFSLKVWKSCRMTILCLQDCIERVSRSSPLDDVYGSPQVQANDTKLGSMH